MEGLVYLNCSACRFGFIHAVEDSGKSVGSIGGATAGAAIGVKVGFIMGPIGALAGSVPGVVLGWAFGKNLGNQYDRPKCPKCGTKFYLPENFR